MTVAFLPNFNLLASIWLDPAIPLVDPPTQADVPCQVYAQKVIGTEFTPGEPGSWLVAQQLRFPALTDIRYDIPGSAINCWVECPQGSRVLYEVHQVQDFHKGFPNEYRVAYVILKSTSWPMP